MKKTPALLLMAAISLAAQSSWGQDSSSPPATSPKQTCRNYFYENFRPLHHLVMQFEYCGKSPLIDLFVPEVENWKKVAWEGCLKRVSDDAPFYPQLINRCTDIPFRNAVANGNYSACLSQNKVRGTAGAIQACSSANPPTLSSAPVSSTSTGTASRTSTVSTPTRPTSTVVSSPTVFESCFKSISDQRLSTSERGSVCRNEGARRELKEGTRLIDCVVAGRDIGKMTIDGAINQCVLPLRRMAILSPDFGACLSGLDELKLNHEGRNVCLDTPSSYVQAFSNHAFRACAERGRGAAYAGFFELQSRSDVGYGTELDVLSDCKGDLNSQRAQTDGAREVRVLGDLHIHSKQAWVFKDRRESVLIGGLSGISYDAKSGEFLTVSDSKSLSHVFRLGLELPTQSEQHLRFKYASFTEIGDGVQNSELMDHEDLAVMRNGDLIISSELSSNTSKSKYDLQIVHYSSGGDQISKILLPKEFEPVPGKAPVSSTGQGKQASTPSSTHGSGSGMLSNSGIEGIALSPDETYVIAANEKALRQDPENQVRLAILPTHAGSGVEATMLNYSLDPLPGAGLVSMTFADASTLLVLERGFDTQTQKNSVRIYKTKLYLRDGVPVSIGPKKLLADLALMVSEFSAGFRVIDNFEGMTFGPSLPNGNRTLVLVSDNNFNPEQRTALVVLEVAEAALK